jgi:hypothetical protein
VNYSTYRNEWCKINNFYYNPVCVKQVQSNSLITSWKGLDKFCCYTLTYLLTYLLNYLLTYLLTYILTPYSRVLLENLTGFAANQEIPRILRNNTKSSLPYSQAPATCPYPVPTTTSHFLKIHLNIILPPTPWSRQWSLSLWC